MIHNRRRTLLLVLLLLRESGPAAAACGSSCPAECVCSREGLTAVPQDLPANITSLKLDQNRIETVNQSSFSRYGSLTGRHLFTCGSRGSGPGQLNGPGCVITDREDNIIVADYLNQRVSLFSRDGTFIRHVLTGEEHGLIFPTGLALTHDGHLVVSEYLSHSIKLFQVK